MNNEIRSDESRGQRPWARPRDFILLGIIAVAALALLLIPTLMKSSDDIEVLIYYEGLVIDRFVLEEGTARVLSYDQLPAIEIQQWPDRSIAIVRSDCPDQICVNTGKLRVAGQFAACLPNNFVIVLQGVTEAEGVDAVA
ncbi:MAG: hypothetical protein GX763_01980 [Clostridiaceae bacterium]|nr:hypothetical protein [Clostridiaceae bacterium]